MAGPGFLVSENQLMIDRVKYRMESWPVVLGLSGLVSLGLIYRFIFPLNILVLDRDYAIQLWNLWWVNEAIKNGQNPYVTDLIFSPVGANLARYNLSPGFFPVTWLVRGLTGGDPLYPLYARRILVWLCFSLLLASSYLFLRELKLSRLAALVPAVAYTFGDVYVYNTNRALNGLSGFFIPLIAFFLVRLYQQPNRRNALICAGLYGLALYFTEFALYTYMATFFLVVGLLAFFPAERRMLTKKIGALGLANILLAALFLALVALPFLVNWFASEALPPIPGEAYQFSANIMGFIVPFAESTPLYGPLFVPLSDRGLYAGAPGREIFMGYPFLLLGLIGLAQNQYPGRGRRLWIGGMALLFLVLSLGPSLKLFQMEIDLPMPYDLLGSIPPFNVGRTPVRYAAMAYFWWMILAAYGLTWLRSRLAGYGRAVATAIPVLILVWVTAEVYSVPLQPERVFELPSQLSQMEPGLTLELPLRLNDGWTLLYQIFHHQPLAVGEVSRQSPHQLAHFETLRFYYAQSVESGTCEKFAAMGVRNIIVRSGVPDEVVAALHNPARCSLNVIDWQ